MAATLPCKAKHSHLTGEHSAELLVGTLLRCRIAAGRREPVAVAVVVLPRGSHLPWLCSSSVICVSLPVLVEFIRIALRRVAPHPVYTHLHLLVIVFMHAHAPPPWHTSCPYMCTSSQPGAGAAAWQTPLKRVCCRGAEGGGGEGGAAWGDHEGSLCGSHNLMLPRALPHAKRHGTPRHALVIRLH